MAIVFDPTDVVCRLDTVLVRDDGEAVGGSEPYLWSVFFKIDGDTARAEITLDGGGLSLRLRGTSTVVSPDEGSHGNLGISGVDAGGWFGGSKTVDVPAAVGRHDDTLAPLPASVTVDGWVADALDDVVLAVQDLIDGPAGGESCPASTSSPSEMVGEFGAEFLTDVVGGVPGVFGAVYLLMEQDFTDEQAAEKARRALRDRFTQELDDTVIPAITESNQGVDELTLEIIESRLRAAVVDAVVAGIDWWWLALGLPGLAIVGDQDDALGAAQEVMSHLDIVGGESVRDIAVNLEPTEHGDWALRGKIGKR